MSAESPIPTPDLAARIGGAYEDYRSIAAAHRRIIEEQLPGGWSFEGKSILDFGCGTGRTLSEFADLAERAEFFGCDIHTESIEWASRELSPAFTLFTCEESPPLPVPDRRFDLVYAMSVFTHITGQWSQWLTELHRVMRPAGLAVISVLGRGMIRQVLNRDWDERIGIAIVDLHKGWEIGGPDVLLGEWWVREHWGRAFEILSFNPSQQAGGHDLVVMRRRQAEVTPETLAHVDPSDPREGASLACNLEFVLSQQETLGDRLRAERAAAQQLIDAQREITRERDNLAAELTRQQARIAEYETESARLQEQLRAVACSRSWRMTAPLRRAASSARAQRSDSRMTRD